MTRNRYVMQYTEEYGQAFAGRYMKLGGGTTDCLSEAAVLGWNAPKAWERHITRWNDRVLVPVTISVFP